jgi:carbonic anhydrase
MLPRALEACEGALGASSTFVIEWPLAWIKQGVVRTSLLQLVASLSIIAGCAGQAPAESAHDAAPALPPAAGHEVDAASPGDSASAAGAAAASETGASPSAPPSAAAPASVAQPEHGEHAEHGEHPASTYIVPDVTEAHSQSPINIETTGLAAGKHVIRFHYQTTREHVDNLGHTVKVTYDAGSTLDYDGKTYALQQFHFHTPSEHLLDGVTYPMELHLVHAEQGHPEHLLVVGVLFKEGQASPWLGTLLADVPGHAGEHADKEARLDIASLLTGRNGYYHYEGSLTTPPYSETVTWLVLEQPRTAAAEQIEALNRIEGNNARHIQARNARPVEHFN